MQIVTAQDVVRLGFWTSGSGSGVLDVGDEAVGGASQGVEDIAALLLCGGDDGAQDGKAMRYIATMREYGVDALKPMTGVSGHAFRDWALLRTQLLVYIAFLFGRTRNREFTLPEFGKFWSDIVDLADRFLDTLPPEKVLRVRFETCRANRRRRSRASRGFSTRPWKTRNG